MGTSAQIESLRKQVAVAHERVRQAEKERLEALHRVEIIQELNDKLLETLKERNEEIETNSEVGERLIPVIDAALTLTGLDETKPLTNTVVDSPNNYMEVRLDHLQQLSDALIALRQFVEGRDEHFIKKGA